MCFISKIYPLLYLIRLDFDFEKLSNTNCTHGDNVLQTLDLAKNECKDNKQCAGVFQENCADEKNYYMCLKNETILTDNQIEGCFYRKFPIGKYLLHCRLSFQLRYS